MCVHFWSNNISSEKKEKPLRLLFFSLNVTFYCCFTLRRKKSLHALIDKTCRLPDKNVLYYFNLNFDKEHVVDRWEVRLKLPFSARQFFRRIATQNEFKDYNWWYAVKILNFFVNLSLLLLLNARRIRFSIKHAKYHPESSVWKVLMYKSESVAYGLTSS